ncbi:F-box only protein 22-like [Schistocerca serialis cubense]|uniref:F-box only protein 22-like n=1 Tax=Schistocerca serialis cubense TaxID=2023355 RepID=UPI00214E46B4|nr:F-box only protein 22-like [Schistocerca serialis cubense]XP_049940475.1 F-box only protein 22-like [Schistocerca serialis cubense]
MSAVAYATRSKTAMAKANSSKTKNKTPTMFGERNKRESELYDVTSCMGEYITTAYGLLRLVFNYLPMKDLRTAAHVCRAWKEAAEHEKLKRENIDWSFWRKTTSSTLLNLVNVAFRRETFCASQVCLSFMCGRGVEPHIECGKGIASCPYSTKRVACGNTHCVCQYVQKMVHPESCSILLEADGIVGTSTNMDRTEEVEGLQGCVSTLLLPKMTDVNITTFYVDETELDKFKRREFGNKEMCSLLGMNTEVTPLRCVLLFCSSEYHGDVTEFLECLVQVQPEQFVIGGGFFNQFHFVTNDEKKCSKAGAIVGIAFSGNNVHCTSTLLDTDIRCKAEVASLMDEFHGWNLPERNSVAFMFACCGRGKFHYRCKNMESSVFRTYFPNTPLLGAFVQGEIGRKFFYGKTQESGIEAPKRKRISVVDDLLHSYTSVFVHLSFGPNSVQKKK